MNEDMTRCEGYDCKKKESCLRFKMPKPKYATWFLNKPYDEEVECRFYLPMMMERVSDDG